MATFRLPQGIPAGRIEVIELSVADGAEEYPTGKHDQAEDAHVGRGSRRVAFSTTATELNDMDDTIGARERFQFHSAAAG